MVTQPARLAMVTADLWVGCGVGGRPPAALASPPLQSPGGLRSGQSFRFAFVTDGTTFPFPSDIA